MMMNSIATVSAHYLGETTDGFIHGHRYKITIVPLKEGGLKITRASKADERCQTYESIVHFLNSWTNVDTLFSDIFMKKEVRDRVMSAP